RTAFRHFPRAAAQAAQHGPKLAFRNILSIWDCRARLTPFAPGDTSLPHLQSRGRPNSREKRSFAESSNYLSRRYRKRGFASGRPETVGATQTLPDSHI